MGVVVDTQEASPFPTYYLVERGHTALMVICINRREYQTLGSAGALPIGMGVVADPKKCHCPTWVCFHLMLTNVVVLC